MRNNEEHKRLKDLLTDTITLLCKNGLSYSEEFSVDALIGITLDKQEVVLVSIKESIKTVEEALEKEGIEESIDDMDSDYTPTTTKHKKRKRKRSKEHISRKIDRQSGGESDDCFTEFYAASTPSKRLLQNPPQPLKEQQHQQVNSTALNVSVKEEKQDNENEDPVFVKSEKNRDMDKLTFDTPGENNISPAPVFSPPHITTDLSLHNTSGTAEDSINSTPHQITNEHDPQSSHTTYMDANEGEPLEFTSLLDKDNTDERFETENGDLQSQQEMVLNAAKESLFSPGLLGSSDKEDGGENLAAAVDLMDNDPMASDDNNDAIDGDDDVEEIIESDSESEVDNDDADYDPKSSSGKNVKEMAKLQKEMQCRVSKKPEKGLKKVFKCKYCDYKTANVEKKARHRRQHESKMFDCTICGNHYQDRLALKKHIEEKHFNKLTCNCCSKVFTSRQGLWGHYKAKKKDGPFKCSLCEKTFFHKSHLVGHENKHKNIKPFACEDCGKQYTYKTSLVLHKSKLQCKGFKDEAALGQPKVIRCDECWKIFGTRGALLEHRNAKHSNKVYSCNKCEKAFNWRPSMVRHKRTCQGPAPPPEAPRVVESPPSQPMVRPKDLII